MKKIQTRLILFGLAVLIGSMLLSIGSRNVTYAACDPNNLGNCYDAPSCENAGGYAQTGGGLPSGVVNCIPKDRAPGGVNDPNVRNTTKCETAILDPKLCSNDEKGGVWGILLLVLNILTAGVGIVAVGGFIMVAIMWTTSGNSPERVKKAKDMIVNIVIGLIAFGLMYALLQFIIPGGVFKS